MNLQQTLRLTEDIYSYRFAQKAASKANQTLYASSIDFFNAKYNKLKSKVDQAAFDMLASVEQHRQNSADVELFYHFFTQQEAGFQTKELLFYLYMRSLAE